MSREVNLTRWDKDKDPIKSYSLKGYSVLIPNDEFGERIDAMINTEALGVLSGLTMQGVDTSSSIKIQWDTTTSQHYTLQEIEAVCSQINAGWRTSSLGTIVRPFPFASK